MTNCLNISFTGNENTKTNRPKTVVRTEDSFFSIKHDIITRKPINYQV